MEDITPDKKLDGSLTVKELVDQHPGVPAVAMGKQYIKDIGARMAQIAGLKPGSSSIRSPQMIDEIVRRLQSGESMLSILCDPHMPSTSTMWNWREADPDLDARVRKAQAQGQHFLADARLDIAAGGPLSSGDVRRDELFIKTINANVAQRNRQEFGERVQVDHAAVQVVMPDWAVSVSSRTMAGRLTDDREDDEGDDPA